MLGKIFYTVVAKISVNVPNLEANTVVSNALNMVYFVAGVVAVLIIISAGFKYVTSAGSPEAVKSAKNTILYAIVGLIVIILAFSITWFVIGRV